MVRPKLWGVVALGAGVLSVAPGQEVPGLSPLVPEPGFFPILPWGLSPQGGEGSRKPRQGLQSVAGCGFTTAGFVRPESLPECAALGLKAIVYPPPEQSGRRSRDWRKLSDNEIDERVKAMVDAGGDSSAVLGYYIMDEPSAVDFPALGRAVAAVRKYAPGKLAYINLFPSYATLGAPDQSQLGTQSYREYLDRFVSEVKPQLISYDNYLVQYSMDMKDAARANTYYANLLEVREVALKHGLPFWNIVSSNQIRPHTTVPSPANLLLQAYTTLAAGGRGVSWYTFYQGGYHYAPVDNDGNLTATYGYLRMVNRQLQVIGPQMNRLWSTGVFCTAPPPGPIPALPGRLVKEVKANTPVMVGEFTSDDGTEHVMLVNLSLADCCILTFETQQPWREVKAVSPEDAGLLALGEGNELRLAAGQGMLVRLSG
jgi:hypothetical protein